MEQKWDPQQIILEQLYIYIKKKKKESKQKTLPPSPKLAQDRL